MSHIRHMTTDAKMDWESVVRTDHRQNIFELASFCTLFHLQLRIVD